MINRAQIWRVFQTVAIPVLLGLIARRYWGDQGQPEEAPSLYLPLLVDIDFVPRILPVTFRIDVPQPDVYQRVSVAPSTNTTTTPDVTAVVLNWSRFPNVMLITSLLCGPWLEDTIAEVFIWNNNPRKITYEDMKNTGCPRGVLKIHNAPANSFFQARYLACAESRTPFCFVQDDDYLVRPEIIQALRARINETDVTRAIHLLPPHEHLSTSLREIHVTAPNVSHIFDIHVSFAWLGYGTIMHQSEAYGILNILRYLKAPSEDFKMADNFFSILKNRVPEIWFDQGFELGGGQPFTVGSEGDERNRKFTFKAMRYLEALARCGRASCDSGAGAEQTRLPYVSFSGVNFRKPWTRAACRGAPCVLETNIRMLPDDISHTATSVLDMLSLEIKNTEILSEVGMQNYFEHPPSNAVDMKPSSVFRSFTHAMKGDALMLDVINDISAAREWAAVQLVLLVDAATEEILKSSLLGWSSDNVIWYTVPHRPICYDTKEEATVDGAQLPLKECSWELVQKAAEVRKQATGRYFRVTLKEDKVERWIISEVLLRGL